MTPFADKTIDKIKTEDSKPPLGLLCMSKKISLKKECVSEGKRVSMNSNKTKSKFSMEKKVGIKGIRFNTKSKKGNKAIKKLNEIEPALAVNAPRIIPRMYNSSRSYIENPLRPGMRNKRKNAVTCLIPG